MRTLTYYVAASLDGFIAGPDDQIDAFDFSGDSAAWILTEYPETLPAHVRSALGVADAANRHFDTVVMGRRTYEPALAAGITSPYPHLRQLVVSRTLGTTEPPVELVERDPVAAVRALKAEDGAGVWLAGGGALAAALVGEIDELVVKRSPVLLGAGLPLLDGSYRPERFALVGATEFTTGVVVERYRRAG